MFATTLKVRLWLSFPDVTQTKLALSIPLHTCNTFAVNPLKWLRFLGFAIYGREGHLSLSKDGPDLGDYAAPIEACSYFFVSEGKVDPALSMLMQRTTERQLLQVLYAPKILRSMWLGEMGPV